MARINRARSASGTKPDPASGTDRENGNDLKKTRSKSLIIDSTKYRTRLNDKFENRRKWESPNSKMILSDIPGTIVKIFVEKGQDVKKGDQMLILEAMKMNNRIMFHSGGRVKSIRAFQNGELVSAVE